MRTSLLPQPLLYLLLATSTYAQVIVDDLSFGHKGALSPNGRGLPGWSVTSSNHHVQILSDRVILTPPVPGNARGALWADKPVESDTWSAEVAFRASGQDTGSGNLQVWFVKNRDQVSIDSVYTTGPFDGPALVIDQYGGRGGGIRGFLNDGTQNFRSHSSLESLAFGHCDYSYRNKGLPSTLRVTSQHGLSVYIDDRECFSSDKISLPSGYTFGLTAGTSDQPDSFEIQKFVVSTSIPHKHEAMMMGGAPSQAGRSPQQGQPQLQKLGKLPGAPQALPDRSADELKSNEEQFADLHNRLQGLTHQVANIFGEFDRLGRKLDERHNSLMGSLPGQAPPQAPFPIEKIDSLGRRVEEMQRSLDQVRRDVEGKDYREHLNSLNEAIKNVQGGISDSLSADNIGRIISTSGPRVGMFLFIVIAIQVMMAGAYIIYKRRRNSMPKKYL